MKLTRYLFLIVAFTLINSCRYDAYNPDICFEENVLPIFVSRCANQGCHSSTENEAGYSLNSYDGIMQGVKAFHPIQSEVYRVIRGVNPSMPVGGKLSRKEVSTIKIWIQMGAPNSKNCKGCDTTSFTFNAVIKPIVEQWCTGCHNSSNASAGFDLSTYQGISDCIVQKRFLQSIEHLNGYSPMPFGASPLSDCDISKIRQWIKSGYPNN